MDQDSGDSYGNDNETVIFSTIDFIRVSKCFGR